MSDFEKLAEGNAITLDPIEVEGDTSTELISPEVMGVLGDYGIIPPVVGRAARQTDRGARVDLPALGRGVAEGASYGFVDELAGAATRVVPRSTRMALGALMAPEGREAEYMRAGGDLGYEDVRDVARRQQDDARSRAPGSFLTGELGGAVAVSRAVPNAAAGGATRLGRAGRAIGQGFAEGAVAGVGGSTSTGQDLVRDGLVGGTVGGTIATATQLPALAREGYDAATTTLARSRSRGVSQETGEAFERLATSPESRRMATESLDALDDDIRQAADLISEQERLAFELIEDQRIKPKPRVLDRLFQSAPPADGGASASAQARVYLDDALDQVDEIVRDQSRASGGRSAARDAQRRLSAMRERLEAQLQSGDLSGAFWTLDNAKRVLGSAQRRAGGGANADAGARDQLREAYLQFRGMLEDADAWGGMAQAQAANPGWTRYIDQRPAYERAVLDPIGTERAPNGWDTIDRADPARVASLMRNPDAVEQSGRVADLMGGAQSQAQLAEELEGLFGGPGNAPKMRRNLQRLQDLLDRATQRSGARGDLDTLGQAGREGTQLPILRTLQQLGDPETVIRRLAAAERSPGASPALRRLASRIVRLASGPGAQVSGGEAARAVDTVTAPDIAKRAKPPEETGGATPLPEVDPELLDLMGDAPAPETDADEELLDEELLDFMGD